VCLLTHILVQVNEVPACCVLSLNKRDELLKFTYKYFRRIIGVRVSMDIFKNTYRIFVRLLLTCLQGTFVDRVVFQGIYRIMAAFPSKAKQCFETLLPVVQKDV
jgi:hypothetical protein